jgi:hypothetical protein
MSEGLRLVWEVEEVTDNDVDKNSEIIGVEILVSRAGSEK